MSKVIENQQKRIADALERQNELMEERNAIDFHRLFWEGYHHSQNPASLSKDIRNMYKTTRKP